MRLRRRRAALECAELTLSFRRPVRDVDANDDGASAGDSGDRDESETVQAGDDDRVSADGDQRVRDRSVGATSRAPRAEDAAQGAAGHADPPEGCEATPEATVEEREVMRI